tara:strand:- start:1619 stop:2011 length:393 start_codon:yes stop_codon:yes gene_type:complete
MQDSQNEKKNKDEKWDNVIKEMQSPRDDLDSALYKWATAIQNEQSAGLEAAEAEANFKGWEAASQDAMINGGASVSRALVSTRSTTEWAERYLAFQKASVAKETKKRIVEFSRARWETERTRQVSLRQVQ